MKHNTPDNSRNLSGQCGQSQNQNLSEIQRIMTPVTKSIPDLLEDSMSSQEPFRAFVEKGEVEIELSYKPPRPGKKRELGFKLRS